MISEVALDRLTGMLRPPDLSGTRYEILAELGRGGMGSVYLARDTALDREVALKIVERGAAGTRSDSPDALAHEARILARLEHPGIVPVHDFGELPDGYLILLMNPGHALNIMLPGCLVGLIVGYASPTFEATREKLDVRSEK